MIRQEFNQTGLFVTPLGLGLAALGRPGYINLGHADDLDHEYDVVTMESHAHSVLDAAWENGIRYFDAARSYGRAEAFLASWLQSREIRPADVVVGSKWGYTYTADWQIAADKHEVKDHTLPVFLRQIEESRQLLGKYLNLYQIHSATLDSGVLGNIEVLKALSRLRDSGMVIGLSLSGPNQSQTLRNELSFAIDGAPLFRSVQVTWHLLSREATRALSEAHDAGMGVIIKEALANGRLTARNEEPDFARKRRTLTDISRELGLSIDALALAAVLAQPWADIVLSGAARKSHLTSNLRALEVAWTAELESRLATIIEPAEKYWQTRSAMDWN